MRIYQSQIAFMVFILCFGFVSVCHAISFGAIKVYSYLDEPLVAELELTDLNGVDTSNLLVNLADSKDFVRAGMDRPYFLTNLLFDIIVYRNKIYIYIRSTKPVKTPYLEFLLNLSWPEGSLIKEYTILIDPPPFDLNSETRPKSVSQLALDESNSNSFNDDNIKQQLDAQDLASRPNVVVQRPRDFNKNALSDETIDAEDPSTVVKTELVPEVVPDITEQSIPRPAVPPQSLADEQEYKRLSEEFKEREQQQADKEKDSASKDLLDRVIERLKASSMLKGSKVDTDHIAEDRKKHLQAVSGSGQKGATKEVVTANAKKSDNLKPPAVAPATPPPAAATAPATVPPAAPTLPPPAVPDVAPAAPDSAASPTPSVPAISGPPAMQADQSEGLKSSFMILVGVFILILAASIGFILKRRLRAKPVSYAEDVASADTSSVVPSTPSKENKQYLVDDDDDLDFDLDLSEQSEGVEGEVLQEDLKSTASADLDKFEEELTNVDLDKLLQTEKVPTATIIETQTENIDITAVPIVGDDEHIELLQQDGNTNALNLKIELAKRYLEAGDKDSAREILRDVIAEAKNEQKLAAEILLSGIL